MTRPNDSFRSHYHLGRLTVEARTQSLTHGTPRTARAVESIAMTERGWKQLELLEESVPKISRLAVLWDPGDANGAG